MTATTSSCNCSDSLFFLRAWVRNPLRVASATPSSRSLSQLITREVGPETGRVIELGPGTGVFTRALLDRGVKESDLILVERGPEFMGLLSGRFPQATILGIDAARVGAAEIGGAPVGAVVSGLPLLSMPPRKVMAILANAFRHLDAGGHFYQFTYGPRCPVPRAILDRLGLKAVLVGRTLQNFPPAAVYRISRRRRFPLL